MELNVVTTVPLDGRDSIEIKVWKNKKILIRKQLILLRIAQFLWFGSGRLDTPFLALLLKHRGLTLIEFTSVYSFIFLSQFLVAYICGIIVDKIGNAKPALLFNMTATVIIIICIIFAPNIGNEACKIKDNIHLNTPENNTNMLFCNYTFCDIDQNNILSRKSYEIFLNVTNVTLETNKLFENGSIDKLLSISDEVSTNALLDRATKLFKNDTNEDIFSFSNDSNTLHNKNYSCVNSNQTNSCPSTSRTLYTVLYSLIIIAFYSVWSTAFRFLDLLSLSLAECNDSHLGKERFFGVMGSIVVTSLVSLVFNIDKSKSTDFYVNIYWISVALKTFCIIAIYNNKAVVHPTGRNLFRSSFLLFTEMKIMLFLCVVFVAGCAFSYSHISYFLFLEDLNAPKGVFGFHLMTTPAYGLPILILSKWFLKKIGTTKIFICGLLAHSINAVGYSFLYNPWFSLLIELTIPFSFHLFWVTAVVHSKAIAPKGLSATLNSITGAIHFGVGRSFGVTVGGLLANSFGMRVTYRILGSVCLSTAILYVLLLSLFSKKSEIHDKDLEENEQMKNTNEEDV